MAKPRENSIPCSGVWFYDFIFPIIDHVHKTSKEMFLVLWLLKISGDMRLFKEALRSAYTCTTLSPEAAGSTAVLSFIFKLFELEREAFKKSRVTSKPRGRNCQ